MPRDKTEDVTVSAEQSGEIMAQATSAMERITSSSSKISKTSPSRLICWR
ncbi:MAG: hypothetical protein MO846_04845 [Candidatus Devosia symbiotica]|nr:hypothetical protein [Candidatus Devosia symbiotica]